MRSLEEIKKINECTDPDDDWRDSAVPIIPPITNRDWEDSPRVLDPPPMYKYVKCHFNVPATWGDHLKISIRAWAFVHLADHLGGIFWRLAIRLTNPIRYSSIPITYEIHAAPKITRRGAK